MKYVIIMCNTYIVFNKLLFITIKINVGKAIYGVLIALGVKQLPEVLTCQIVTLTPDTPSCDVGHASQSPNTPVWSVPWDNPHKYAGQLMGKGQMKGGGFVSNRRLLNM